MPETRLCLFSSVLSLSSALTLHLIWEVGTGQRASSSLESMIALLLTPWTNINRSLLNVSCSLSNIGAGENFPQQPHRPEPMMSYRVRTFIIRSFRELRCPACNKVLSGKCPEEQGRVSCTCGLRCRAQGLIYNAFGSDEASDLWLV